MLHDFFALWFGLLPSIFLLTVEIVKNQITHFNTNNQCFWSQLWQYDFLLVKNVFWQDSSSSIMSTCFHHAKQSCVSFINLYLFLSFLPNLAWGLILAKNIFEVYLTTIYSTFFNPSIHFQCKNKYYSTIHNLSPDDSEIQQIQVSATDLTPATQGLISWTYSLPTTLYRLDAITIMSWIKGTKMPFWLVRITIVDVFNYI